MRGVRRGLAAVVRRGARRHGGVEGEAGGRADAGGGAAASPLGQASRDGGGTRQRAKVRPARSRGRAAARGPTSDAHHAACGRRRGDRAQASARANRRTLLPDGTAARRAGCLPDVRRGGACRLRRADGRRGRRFGRVGASGLAGGVRDDAGGHAAAREAARVRAPLRRAAGRHARARSPQARLLLPRVPHPTPRRASRAGHAGPLRHRD
mmetsp:Transcript_35523/g.118784  ORF Transcript_35523/g.118784 Transcript_35523/m.118784 type:complete len:210 (+) Transcript_35523:1252-1881(+)